MTKNKAVYTWFNELMTFYRDSAVPEDAELPYGTYTYIDDAWDGGQVNFVVNLWFRTESEAVPDEAAQKLSDKIGYGGALIPCDEGYVWLKRGTPWCQSITNTDDPAIKRRYINVTAEYLTFS